jgi:predicted transcriptional regulator
VATITCSFSSCSWSGERERSTAYRSIQRLLGAGILQKEQINYDHGGYYHVYRVADSSDMAQHMQRMLNDWYAQVGQLIQEFEDKYEGTGSIEVPS